MTKHKLGQSKVMTIFESFANVGTGMFIAFSISQLAYLFESQIQMYIWSGFVWNVGTTSNVIMTIVLTVVSVCRGYIWRRVFNKLHINKLHEQINIKENK